MALVGVKLETLVSEPDALTTRPSHYFFDSNYSSWETLDRTHILSGK